IGAWAAWLALLADHPPVDVEKLLEWAERVRSSYSEPGSVLQGFAHTLAGAALCRAGRFDTAITQLENWPAGEGSAWDWLLLAWAHQTVGHSAEARQWLRKAYLWFGWISPKTVETPKTPRPLPWHHKLEVRLLRTQIEPLFQSS